MSRQLGDRETEKTARRFEQKERKDTKKGEYEASQVGAYRSSRNEADASRSGRQQMRKSFFVRSLRRPNRIASS
jgi:hypothetical protein